MENYTIESWIHKKYYFDTNIWTFWSGMLYLNYKYPNICIPMLDKLKEHKQLFSPKLKEYLHLQTCLYWDENSDKIYIPSNFWESVKECLLKKDIEFIIIPFGYECKSTTGHANIIVYNVKSKEMELFEPYGYLEPNNCIKTRNISKKIKKMFNKNIKKDMVKIMYAPLDFSPVESFQAIQEWEQSKEPKGQFTDPIGFCQSWSVWYADTRMANPDKTRNEVIDISIQIIKNKSSFVQFIRSYSNFLVHLASEFIHIDRKKSSKISKSDKTKQRNKILEKYDQEYEKVVL